MKNDYNSPEVLVLDKKILAKKIGYIDGCRKMHRLINDLDLTDNMFHIFTLVLSDTDYYPIDEDIRNRWDENAL